MCGLLHTFIQCQTSDAGPRAPIKTLRGLFGLRPIIGIVDSHVERRLDPLGSAMLVKGSYRQSSLQDMSRMRATTV